MERWRPGGRGETARWAPARPGPSIPNSPCAKGLANLVPIAAAESGAAALFRDGKVFAWGRRDGGVIGDGHYSPRQLASGEPALEPVRVPGVSGILQIATGSSHVLALTGDGPAITWGSNCYGAQGRAPRRGRPMDVPGEVPGLTGVIAVAGGNGVSTVLRKDGTVWVWGRTGTPISVTETGRAHRV